MRTTLFLVLLGLAILAGCGGLDASGLLGDLQGLGPTVCTAYDFNGDGVVTVAEVQEVFGTSLSASEIQDALSFYGCTAQ